MMNFDDYKNPVVFPVMPSVAQGIQINVRKSTLDEALTSIDKWKDQIVDYYKRRDVYNAKRKEYDAAEAAIYDKFKRDVLKELGLTKHPKADVLFNKAWERGHSCGYQEVWYVAKDLADLLTDE